MALTDDTISLGGYGLGSNGVRYSDSRLPGHSLFSFHYKRSVIGFGAGAISHTKSAVIIDATDGAVRAAGGTSRYRQERSDYQRHRPFE